MAAGISINIASETRDYATGIQKGMIEPSEEALAALERMGKSNAGEELQRSMEGAQRTTQDVKQDIAALSRQVQEGGRAGGKYGRDMKAGLHEADEGVKAAKENTAQNLKEVAASFDGTVQGGVQGIQGLAAEILEGFGPGGLVAGAVLAGGIGLLLTGIQDADTRTEAFKADVQALAQSWIEAGKEGKLSTSQIADGIKALATQTDTSKASLADVEKQAKALGIPFKELAKVYAEGGDATQYAINRTKQLIDLNREQAALVGRSGARVGPDQARVNAARAAELAGLQGQLGKLKDVQRETTEAHKREQDWLKAGGPDLERKAAATESYATGVQSALHEAGSSWDDYATKEGGLSLEKYIKVTEAKVRAIEQYQRNLGALSNEGNQAALDYVESLGTDAAPLLDRFVHAPEKERAKLVAIWARLGKASSTSYNSALQDGLPDVVIPPPLMAPDDTAYLAAVKEANRKARQYLKDHPLQAGAVAYTSYGKPIYQ
jgi:hypothetical protein